MNMFTPDPDPTHHVASLAPAEEKMIHMPTAVAVLDDVDDAIVSFITAYRTRHGYPPSVREIGKEVGFTSTSSVHHRLRKIERAGAIRRAEKRSRAISVADSPVDECPAA